MTAPVVRRLRLPAMPGSPAAARTAVSEAVRAVGLGGVLDETLLLTTELVTNSVVHVGTDLEIEIVADPEAVTVTVLDRQRAPIAFTGFDRARGQLPDVDQLAERGRGLLLVDRLADCWGTLHHRDGKGVWFRLGRRDAAGLTGDAGPRDDAVHAPQAVGRSVAVPAASPVAAGALARAYESLGSVFEAAQGRTRLAETVADLLRRLCEATGAAVGSVLIDEADGGGTRLIAGYEAAAPDGARPPAAGGRPEVRELREAIRLSRPWRGELVLEVPDDDAIRPLVALTAERITLLVENHRLRRTGTARRAWLTFLAEVSELLAQSLDVELTLALVPRLVVPRLGRWCVVHTADGDGGLTVAAAAHADETQLAELLSMLHGAIGLVHEALRTDGAVPLPAPVDGYAVALLARGQRLGTLTVGAGAQSWLGTEEMAVVEDVARRAALAIDNARIHADRRAVAQALQRSLLPPRLPKVAGMEFGAEYVPTGGGVDVGGDFYDVVALSDGGWVVVVGDVSGKGVQAATVTGLVRDVTRVLVRDGRPLPEALARLNETLVERGGGRFCTLALASVSPRGEGVLDVCLHLAGHDQPILVAAGGTASPVGRCGTALGLLDTVHSPSAMIVLQPGDTLVFYTDGVTERRRGDELFGRERLRREAASLAGFPAEVVAARLRAATLGFSPEVPRDDIAIFALRNDRTG